MAAHLELDERGSLLIVSIVADGSRPPAYDGAFLHALGDAYRHLDATPALRVAVVRSTSDRAFCVGADIAAVARGGFDDGPYPEVAEGLASKPTIAAVEGLCLGGGVMIATGCDLRVAGDGARFGVPEARWNLPAQWLGALARQMLPAHALELAILADEQLPAQRLLEMGWLNRVVPTGQAFATACALAEQVSALAPRALRHSRELIRAAAHLAPAEATALGMRHAADLMAMQDTREGAEAFAQRRPPRFLDR